MNFGLFRPDGVCHCTSILFKIVCVGGRYNPCIDLLVPMQLTVNQPSILFSILLIGDRILLRPSLLDGKDVDDAVMGYFFFNFESLS